MNDNKKINIKNAEEASGGGYNIFSNVKKVAGDAGHSYYYCETCKKKLNTLKELQACVDKGHKTTYF